MVSAISCSPKGSSKEKLAKLYPNYFGDISDFVKLIEKNLDAFA